MSNFEAIDKNGTTFLSSKLHSKYKEKLYLINKHIQIRDKKNMTLFCKYFQNCQQTHYHLVSHPTNLPNEDIFACIFKIV